MRTKDLLLQLAGSKSLRSLSQDLGFGPSYLAQIARGDARPSPEGALTIIDALIGKGVIDGSEDAKAQTFWIMLGKKTEGSQSAA